MPEQPGDHGRGWVFRLRDQHNEHLEVRVVADDRAFRLSIPRARAELAGYLDSPEAPPTVIRVRRDGASTLHHADRLSSTPAA